VAGVVDPGGVAGTRAVASDAGEGAEEELGRMRDLGYDTYAVGGRGEVLTVACAVAAHAILDHDGEGHVLVVAAFSYPLCSRECVYSIPSASNDDLAPSVNVRAA
jgi:hypothetical protein